MAYHTIQDEELTLRMEDVPAGWVITTDRRYLQQADAVVFHFPGLYQVLDNDLAQREGQVWISRYTESEMENTWMEDPDIRDMFDYWICYHPDEEQKEHPFVQGMSGTDSVDGLTGWQVDGL